MVADFLQLTASPPEVFFLISTGLIVLRKGAYQRIYLFEFVKHFVKIKTVPNSIIYRVLKGYYFCSQ